MEKVKKKVGSDPSRLLKLCDNLLVHEQAPIDNFEQSQNLSTSVFNNQQAKVLSIKNNQLYQSNLQTAQKRDLENIFNTNALANYELEINNPLPKPYSYVYYFEFGD